MAFYNSKLFLQLTADTPIVLLDIGARGGIPRQWQPVGKSIKVIGFEPDAGECRKLNSAAANGSVYYPVALAGKKGTIILNITRDPNCASILEPNMELLDRFQGSEDVKLVNKTDILCDTLDEVVSANSIPSIDFLKIDTQGTELDILRGAEKTLEQAGVFGIEVEMEFSPLYKSQPVFSDVDTFLRGKGFTLFDIRDVPGRKIRKTAPAGMRKWRGQALWTDGLYFRDVPAEKNKDFERLSRESAMKTIAITELFGLGDYALELLDLYSNEKIISAREVAIIRKALFSGTKQGLEPEAKLMQGVKSTFSAYAYDRLPFLYKILLKMVTGRRVKNKIS
jgi:FkbM family methyltransferase